MKPIIVVLAATAWVATPTAPAQESGGCVGMLPISRLIVDALPEAQRLEGHEAGGSANNQRHIPFPVPEGRPRLEGPRYPVHTSLEFNFLSDIDDPDAFRVRACSAIEEALVSSCGSVERSDRVRSCSFRTSDAGRTGMVDLLPDEFAASARMLIVVASEW